MELTAAVYAVASALEAKIETLSRRIAEHSAREAELRRVRENDEAVLKRLQATLASLEEGGAELGRVSQELAVQSPDVADRLDLMKRYSVSTLVRLHVLDKPPGELFGATVVAAEIVRRFARHLRRPVAKPLVSTALRRLAEAGILERIKKGNPHKEALFRRAIPPQSPREREEERPPTVAA